jgi:hypothetical protein
MILINLKKYKNIIKIDYINGYYILAFNSIIRVFKSKEEVLKEIENLLSIFA